MRKIFIVIFLFVCTIAGAQTLPAGHFIVEGKVIDSLSEEGVKDITVSNLSLKTTATTNADGTFKLEAAFSNRIEISNPGYRTRFTTILSQPLSPLRIVLVRQSTSLQEVVFSRKRAGYAAEAEARHSTYARVLGRQKDGSVMSPVSFIAEKLSKRSKRMFRFQEDFARMEDERFVDSRYTPQLAASMTHLTGDTLAYFMNAYPMPMDLAQNGSDLELKQWIRNNYKDWQAKGSHIPSITADSTFHR